MSGAHTPENGNRNIVLRVRKTLRMVFVARSPDSGLMVHFNVPSNHWILQEE